MGFLDSLKSIFSAPGNDSGYWIYVRCRKCGEVIKTRLDLNSSLSQRDEGGYVVNKTLIGGNNLCFQRIEVTLYFDQSRHMTDREINFGEFITAEAYESAQSSDESQG